MSTSGRLVICNMTVEAGATSGLYHMMQKLYVIYGRGWSAEEIHIFP